MQEILLTRTEHSRNLENADKYKAIETLKEIGLLIPVTELETFHGRVATPEETDEWVVDPSFTNGRNDNDNFNLNHRPTLYTGDQQTATDFANRRRQHAADIDYHYLQVFREKVRNYTSEERKEWEERENKRHAEWYESLSPEDKKREINLLDEKGNLKPYILEEADVYFEAQRLVEEATPAEKEAIKKKVSEAYRVELHQIVSGDSDATILDFDFDDTELNDEAYARYKKALEALILPITEGSPVDFYDHDQIQPFVAAAKNARISGYISNDDVADLAAAASIDERVALQLASAFNARRIAQVRPSYLASEFLLRPDDIFSTKLQINDKQQEIPINLEYVQRFLREAHIVGVRQRVKSATLKREITCVSFFDLEKTSTKQALAAEQNATRQKLGDIAATLSKVSHPETTSEPLLNLLDNAYIKPETLIDAAKSVTGYNEIFEQNAGNWEGYTLAEHTETVLRNFDESFADKLPVQLLAPMRLAIIAHDLGKPVAAANGERHRQTEYNLAQASDFLNKLGVDSKLKGLVLAIIGEGEELAFQIEIRGAGQPALAEMRRLATDTMKQFNNSEDVTDMQIDGFAEMCKILQTCDGGAYTSMSITRSTKNGGGRYRNAASFNSSFAHPVGLGKRTVRLRREGDKPAEADLTPKGSTEVSKLVTNLSVSGRKAPKLSD